MRNDVGGVEGIYSGSEVKIVFSDGSENVSCIVLARVDDNVVK